MIDTLVLDPGTASGLAAGDSRTGRIIYSTRVVEPAASWKATTGRDRTGEYIARLRHEVTVLRARGLDLRTAHLAVEAPFVGRFPGAGLALAQRIGIWKAIVCRDVPEIPNPQWKAALGLPNGGKDDVEHYKRYASTLPGVPPTHRWTKAGDEAAACCICAHVMARVSVGLPILMSDAEIDGARKRREKARRQQMPPGWSLEGDRWTSSTGAFVLTETDGWWYATAAGEPMTTPTGKPMRGKTAPSLARAVERETRR